MFIAPEVEPTTRAPVERNVPGQLHSAPLELESLIWRSRSINISSLWDEEPSRKTSG